MTLSSSSSPPVSPVTPLPPKPASSWVGLNVRQVLETQTVAEAKEVSRKVQLEIEKKKEELRMLVGERYRDLIDAADTIGVMKESSRDVVGQLVSLRGKFSSFPGVLEKGTRVLQGLGEGDAEAKEAIAFTPADVAAALELKLTLEVPRQVKLFLDKDDFVQVLHLWMYYNKYLKSGVGEGVEGLEKESVCERMKASILQRCEDYFLDGENAAEKLAECMMCKQVLLGLTSADVLSELLRCRADKIMTLVEDNDPSYLQLMVATLQSVQLIFIDPQLYNQVGKRVRKPSLRPVFVFKYSSGSLEKFESEAIFISEPLRVTSIAEIVLNQFVTPLTIIFGDCFDREVFTSVSGLTNFQQLNDFRKNVTDVLNKHKEIQDLLRIVLGSSKNLWTEIFQPVFTAKCHQICKNWVQNFFGFLCHDALPRFAKLHDQFELASFVWKAPGGENDKFQLAADTDLALKLNCIPPHMASLCDELEEQLQNFFTDFQCLGDGSIKDFISHHLLEQVEEFLNFGLSEYQNPFVARLCTALQEFCPTFSKILNQNDKNKMKQILTKKCESCWTSAVKDIADRFSVSLHNRIPNLQPSTLSHFMPVAEDFSSQSEEGEAVKASVKVPSQLSVMLQSLLFGVCVEMAQAGPQPMSKTVKDTFRLTVGRKVVAHYQILVEETTSVLPQVAAQLIFDLKFVQWFHPTLSDMEDMKQLLLKLQAGLDPFDLNIVMSRIKVNLKRCLFESSITLGLLFSEESHSFIAQNFKTKMTQSLPILLTASSQSSFPLLPI